MAEAVSASASAPLRTKKLQTLDISEFRRLYAEFNAGQRPFEDVQAFVKKEAAPILRDGIIQVSHHDIPIEVKDAAYTDMQRFFALSDEEKAKYVDDVTLGDVTNDDFQAMSNDERKDHLSAVAEARGLRPFERGFVPYGTMRVEDWKDMWQLGPERPSLLFDKETGEHSHREISNVWPDQEIPSFRPNTLELYERMKAVCEDGLRIVAIDLDLDPEYFAQHHGQSADLMRVLNYKPYKDAPEGTTFATAHRDRDAATCIFPESGLQELDIKTGQWVDLDTDAGNVVLFTGDVPDGISNGIYPSKVHRVPAPQPGQVGFDGPRMTVPFFKNMDQDFVVAPVPEAIRQSDGEVRYPLAMNFGQIARDTGSQWVKVQDYARHQMGLTQVTDDPDVINQAVGAVVDQALRS